MIRIEYLVSLISISESRSKGIIVGSKSIDRFSMIFCKDLNIINIDSRSTENIKD
jgi:hypothetical protein